MNAVCLRDIKELLAGEIGLDPGSLGDGALTRAVSRCSRRRGFDDPEEYVRKVCEDPGEAMRLVEEVVVPETWFFRDSGPFDLLARRGADRVGRGKSPFRVLSSPCSTGEEPYSAAMVLLRAGLAPGDAVVEGVDISGRALETARAGLYFKNSFRGAEPDWAGEYFQDEEVDGEACRRVVPLVREMVRFRPANLTPGRFCRGEANLGGGTWDAVFCRNFLIYLDREAKEGVLDRIARVLEPDGVLFVGHAETGILLGRGFAPLPEPGAFAFTPAPSRPLSKSRSRAGSGAARNDGRRASLPGKARAFPDRAAPAGASVPDRRPGEPAPGASPSPGFSGKEPSADPSGESKSGRKPRQDHLALARSLADEGRLEEAGRACLKAVEECPGDADRHHLLGLVQEALGDMDQARKSFQRAVYLDPDHEEALLCLSLLAARIKDEKGAAAYRNRLERVRRRRSDMGEAVT